eukprot:CAMPEP_0180490002 /NCGR_PEP_ID=MMETSP1036_2-20121128/38888_1 /TAXON_ID=632150 /ORGANISM="Azadinium spinosum, Strain 3D9" /LENGTH=373 /DNA_ID=CAMNT_0022498177 /DNA_START=160 /DNA_END=1278 /DNA_ORIENTATION=-
MAVEIQYRGLDIGHTLGAEKYDEPAQAFWFDMDTIFDVLDIFFNAAFALELFLRLAGGRWQAVTSPWIWFDTFLVVTGILDLITQSNHASCCESCARDPRAQNNPPSQGLRLFISIDIGYSVERWGSHLVIRISVNLSSSSGYVYQPTPEYLLEDTSVDENVRLEVFAYFGTFSNTMVTMFEITLSNWVPSCRLLMDNVSDWFGLFYILYCCCFSFAVIRVIAAIFLTETMKIVAQDEQIAMVDKTRTKQAHMRKIDLIFEELDTGGDGSLTKAEFDRFKGDDLLQSLLDIIGISPRDFENLFMLIDSDGNGYITRAELIEGLSRLRGSSSEVDMLVLTGIVREMKEDLCSLRVAMAQFSMLSQPPSSKPRRG